MSDEGGVCHHTLWRVGAFQTGSLELGDAHGEARGRGRGGRGGDVQNTCMGKETNSIITPNCCLPPPYTPATRPFQPLMWFKIYDSVKRLETGGKNLSRPASIATGVIIVAIGLTMGGLLAQKRFVGDCC